MLRLTSPALAVRPPFSRMLPSELTESLPPTLVASSAPLPMLTAAFLPPNPTCWDNFKARSPAGWIRSGKVSTRLNRRRFSPDFRPMALASTIRFWTLTLTLVLSVTATPDLFEPIE